MPSVLICASTLSHINHFHLPYLVYFAERGYQIHVAAPGAAGYGHADFGYDITLTKRYFSWKNLVALQQLYKLFKSRDISLLLTHTTLAGVVARLALRLAGKKNTTVIHTCHGYLFWKGCTLVRRLAYYLPERQLRGVTDCIITMNSEDTLAAKNLVRPGGLVEKVPGMGVDGNRFMPAPAEDKARERKNLEIPAGAKVLVYAAEFSQRKNHMELMRAMPLIVQGCPEVLLLLCGTGKTQGAVRTEITRRGLGAHVRCLGWRSDMPEIYAACDAAVSTSACEGLPFNIIEAQLCGLPVVASRIRGHTDLIRDQINGWTYSPGNEKELARQVLALLESDDLGKKQGRAARSGAKAYTLERAFQANTDVYQKTAR